MDKSRVERDCNKRTIIDELYVRNVVIQKFHIYVTDVKCVSLVYKYDDTAREFTKTDRTLNILFKKKLSNLFIRQSTNCLFND